MRKEFDFNPWFSIWTRARATIHEIVSSRINHRFFSLCFLYGLLVNFHTMQQTNMARLNVSIFGATLFALIFAFPVGWLSFTINAWLVRLVGRGLFKGRGSFLEVRAAVSWATVPYLVNLAIWVIFLGIFGMAIFSPYFILINIPVIEIALIIQLVTTVWSVVVLSQALGEVQKFSAWKGFFSVLLSWLIVVVVVCTVFFIIAAILR